ncbi:hypothetical protein L1987_19868 [Smallanthus sonchifolius]|uniref:Uncharacterized protein n=1 Tax=Smallanthus sonchifolius TaxID=185202 RepID=A0ACB9IR14_9ASTR|nr:hypothetical protein L1987_19868 [Smallanthus sonchifolius]
MAEISAAINQIDVKKQNLHKSFLHLQSQSPSSFNLPLNWPDLDSYFTTLHSSLHSKFNLLQTLRPPSDSLTVPARPELKSFCQNSDGLGLNRFIALAPDRLSILSELPDAYRYAPDAPAMVLDAMVSFYSPESKGSELLSFRSGCSIMLDGLVRVKPDITIELKDKAMEMAVQWNQIRVSSSGYIITKEQEALGFLLLIGAYGLVDRFSIHEIIECFLVVAKRRQAVDLCRRIIPPNNINDVIQKLIDEDMHVTAVNFSIELEKTDEFPPICVLEERKLRSMRVIEETRRNVKDLHVCNAVIMKETGELKSIIKCVNENHLESVYPTDSLVELVNELENEDKTINIKRDDEMSFYYHITVF